MLLAVSYKHSPTYLMTEHSTTRHLLKENENMFTETCSRKFVKTSLAVQWLRRHASTVARGMGSIPSQGTQVPHAVQYSQRKKECLQQLYSQYPQTSSDPNIHQQEAG